MKLLAALSVLVLQASGFGLFVALGAVVTILIFGADAAFTVIGFLVENWILQALLAAWIAHAFQTASAKSEGELANLEAAYQRKIDATKALHSLIQGRIYATRRYVAVLRSDPDQIAAERDHYREVVSLWNSQAPTAQVAIISDFGYMEGIDLDHRVFPVFSEIDAMLRNQRIAAQSGKPADAGIFAYVGTQLAALNLYANDLNRDLLARTQQDRLLLVGRAPITEDNYRHLSHFQVIKALVKLPE